MKKSIISLLSVGIVISLLNATPVSGHSPNIAFFDLKPSHDSLYVTAEFPWTLRNALMIDHPELEKAGVTKSEYNEALFDYFEKKIMVAQDGHFVHLAEAVALKSGESHGLKYQLVYAPFSAKENTTISNYALFELGDRVHNYHVLHGMEDHDLKFETSHKAPLHTILINDSLSTLVILCAVCIGITFIAYGSNKYFTRKKPGDKSSSFGLK